MKRKKMKIWKKAAVCAVVLAFLMSACGASGAAKSESAAEEPYYDTYDNGADSVQAPASASYKEDTYAVSGSYDSYGDEEEAVEADMSAAAAEDTGTGEGGSSSEGAASGKEGADQPEQADLKSSNRKIVYTGNISLQTLEYDKASQSIHNKINQYGGFIESEDTYNEDPYWYYKDRPNPGRSRRNLNLTARIPADRFDAFMEDIKKDGQVTSSSVNAQNISVSYATREASKKALEIEQERLLAMMEKAETVEDMIKVERRLTEVERQLNDEKTQLSAMDRDVNFSTVYISVQEVYEYSERVVEVTFAERLQKAFGRAVDGFVTFWQDVVLFVAETFPFLIMWAVVIVLIVRFLRRRHARKMEERIRMEELRRNAAQQAGTPYQPLMPEKKDRKKGFFHRRETGADSPQTIADPSQGAPDPSGDTPDFARTEAQAGHGEPLPGGAEQGLPEDSGAPGTGKTE